MGREARCVGRFGRESGEGRLQLETAELSFRGPFRLIIPLKSITSVEAARGALRVKFEGGAASFDLGKTAEAWVKSIREPKGLLDKLGVKSGQRVKVLASPDAAFLSELKARGAAVHSGSARELDHLFLFVSSEAELGRIGGLPRSLRPEGALWVIRPKGPTGVSEAATRAAGLKAGLVDVKVVAFSPTHTAEKFVIPLSRR